MKSVTVGVLGAGRIGKLRVENILRMRGARVKTVADPFMDETWARDLALNATLNPEEIFSDPQIEAVIICSPSELHTEQVIKAALSGKHVFCEKPIALDPDRIEKALKIVRQQGVKLQVGFNRRFDADFMSLKTAVTSRKIGSVHIIKITSRDPSPPPVEYVQTSGGIFLDMAIHDFDMVRYLSGSEVEQVYAAGSVLVDSAIGIAGDVDTAITSMRLKSGALAVIDNSRKAVFGYDQRIEVFGSRGSMVAGNRTPTETVLSTEEGVVADKPLHFFVERYRESYKKEIREFFKAIREDSDPPVTGRDGLLAIQIGLAAKQSLQENRLVMLQT
ncbi:MAG: inositol 2-dehydrogenase [Candidatus Neomarinimicrobiota bacterium]